MVDAFKFLTISALDLCLVSEVQWDDRTHWGLEASDQQWSCLTLPLCGPLGPLPPIALLPEQQPGRFDDGM